MDPEVKIGYDRIRQQIEALCTTKGAVERLREEGFSSDVGVVGLRLRLAEQMRQVLMMETGFPTGEYYDTVAVVHKADVEGAFLDVDDLRLLRSALGAVMDLVRFFKGKSEERYPDLIGMTKGVNAFPEIVNHIDTIIDKYGVVRDNASSELFDIRRTIRDREGQVAKRLRSILAQAQADGVVESDASISIREGRAVIPVSAANKRKLKGFIHDESATGRTFYVEPVEVVEINNELRELEYRERREIVRILTEFTQTIRPDLPEIEQSGNYLTTMDMIRAKARLAISIGAVMPIISHDGTLELRNARHPILQQALKRESKEIVPLNLTIDRRKHILVISGPNAGGKSVCLKTVGLLQWMFQCGMLVPLLENSQMPLFDAIFIDIGDEQSIDNDLSTYSSHLLNMKRMLQSAGRDSLILIDEFGTGTEPVIGGAIAESILERLEKKGCYGVITTHYSNLKYYASSAEGVINGAMTFDVQNIRPLFQLETGTPGSSFAVEIARKIGLPEDIIRQASEKAGTDHVNIEKQLREISRDKRYWEQKRDRIRVTDRKVEELEARYAEQLATIKQQRAEIIKKAKADAERITADANRQIESAIKIIKESQAESEMTRFVRKEIDEFRDSLSSPSDGEGDNIEHEMERLVERRRRRDERRVQRGEKSADGAQQDKAEEVALVPMAGSKVRMEGQDMVGEVQSVKGKRATVAFGQILTTVELERLTVVSNAEYKKQIKGRVKPTVSMSADISDRKLNFKRNIDLRGMRVAEAMERVEDFVDDAIMLGVSDLRILHGKGTGALKEEIRRYLRTVDLLISAEDEAVQQGGSGITVIKLDV